MQSPHITEAAFSLLGGASRRGIRALLRHSDKATRWVSQSDREKTEIDPRVHVPISHSVRSIRHIANF